MLEQRKLEMGPGGGKVGILAEDWQERGVGRKRKKISEYFPKCILIIDLVIKFMTVTII